MAQLPGVQDLGPAPRVSVYRPASVGGYDTSGYTSGAQALARGEEQLGRGIETAGQDVGEVAARQSQFEYAQAHSQFMTGKVDLDGGLARETNPGPDQATGKSLPNRYADAIWQQRDAAAAGISSPQMRERFLAEVAPTVEHGIVQAQNHATGLQNNADIASTTAQGDTTINQAVTSSDEETRRQLIDNHNRLLEALRIKGAITSEQELAMRQKFVGQYATADALAAINSGDKQKIEAAMNRLQLPPGSPTDLVDRIIQIESGGNPRSRSSTSSAYGAAQFLESRPGGDNTWASLVKQYRPELASGRSLAEINAMRADPNLSREMLGHLIDTNRGILQRNGVEATPGALYLTHFLGPKGAVAVLQANPNQPVADVLAKAVGSDMAAKMVAANQSVLGGRLAGSVTQWANSKMGGAADGHIYDVLNPVERQRLLAEGQSALQKLSVNDATDFRTKEADTQAEAFRTGNVVNPITQDEFIRQYGAENGPKAYEIYRQNLQLGFDTSSVAQMSPQQQRDLLAGYEPQPGATGFAEAEKRHDILVKAINAANTERDKDPAGFAINRLPAAKDAWDTYSKAVSDPTIAPQMRAATAQRFAAVTLAEQERVGIPEDQRTILPKSYIDNFNKQITTAGDADDPQKRAGLIGVIKNEAATWGDQWPAVMRQLAPGARPIVRAIAAGADETAMARLLSLPKEMTPAKIIGEQNDTKIKDVNEAVNKAMQPLKGSLVGRQLERDYPGYADLAEKLTALGVRDGKSPDDAAKDAFNQLVGNRYDFKDTYRIPKSANVSADDVQYGAMQARNDLAALGAKPPADDMPGRTNTAAADLRALGRDGVWVTAPDNSGLNMAYNGKFVRGADDKPLLVPWAELARRGQAAPQAQQINIAP